MKKIILGAAAALALIAVTQSAQAGEVSYSATLGPAALDWVDSATNQTVTLPEFDPSLFGGAMPSSMTLSFSGNMFVLANPQTGGGVQIVNYSAASSSSVFLNGAWTFSLSNGSLIPDFTFSESLNPGPLAVLSGSISNPYVATFAPVGTEFGMTGSETYSPVPFIGSGTFSLDGTDTASIGFTGLATSAAQVEWFMGAGGEVTVTYEVPTPTPLALLGLGLLAMGGLSTIRRANARR